MGKCGMQWLAALEGGKLMHDPAETDQSAEYRLSKYEIEAQAIAKSLIEDKIPDGIASCISRGSDRLGVYVLFRFFYVPCFSGLKSVGGGTGAYPDCWLATQS